MGYGKDSTIVIVGAGVFGLSNAFHLAQNGYTNITVFDRLDMDSRHYTFLEGADTASADLNKIFRAQYENAKHYQDLAFKALQIWQDWDYDITMLPPKDAQKYTGLKLLDLCGMLWLDNVFTDEEKSSRENFAKEGLSSLIFDINNEQDIKRGILSGHGRKLQVAKTLQKTLPDIQGFLDSTSGMLYASRACLYIKQLCVNMGVKFVLGGDMGTFAKFIYSGKGSTEVQGIITKDNVAHLADLTVMCCGPWSTSIVQELDGINEGTSGNVLIFKIPESRKDLQTKYSSENFPIVGWKWADSREHLDLGGIFMFPLTSPEGYMKIIVRQTKYTNPKEIDGKIISIPKTVNSDPPFCYLTKHIVDQVKRWLRTFFPDLVDAGIVFESKVIWYTDTINNDFIFDFVPNKKNLFIACGGSGHAFKMLPVLGQFLVDNIEGRENIYTKLFKWRNPNDFKDDVNGIREKMKSNRRYDLQVMATKKDMYLKSKVGESKL